MRCPHCQSEDTRVRLNQTKSLGYPLYFCRDCQRRFNERTGTPFNHIEVPTDIVFQVVDCRLRFKLSYRDVAELFWLRGFHFTHETVRDWSERFTAEFAEQIRIKRQRTFGRVWYVDETYTVANNVTKISLDFNAIIVRQQSQPALLVLQHSESSSASTSSESCHGETSPSHSHPRG